MDGIVDWIKHNKALILAAMLGMILMGMLIGQGSCNA